MTDHAPRAYAEACRKREMIHGMYQSWLSQHQQDFQNKPRDLVAGMKMFAMGMTSEAVAQGVELRIGKADWHEFSRQFLSQTRAQRFGPIAFIDAAEWRSQIELLCKEYGMTWVDQPQAQVERAA